MRNIFPGSKEVPVTNAPRFQPELAFPELTEGMIDRVRRFGSLERKTKGELLFSQGTRDTDLYLVLNGSIDLFATGQDGEHLHANRLQQGQFTGELDLLSSRRALLNAACATDCLLIRVNRDGLRALMRSEADIANLIMQASMWRRLQFLGKTEGGVTVVGPVRHAEVLKVRRFLTQNSYPHRVVEPEAIESLQYHGDDGSLVIPTIVLADGRVLRAPSLLYLAEELGVAEEPQQDIVYDLVVAGAGPAGLAAAVYGASEGLTTLVVEGIGPGGQAGTSSRIENYLGFPTGVSGEELAYRAQVQAQKFGARLTIARNAVGIRYRNRDLCITLTGGFDVCAHSIVIATGASYRKLEAENYAAFENHGIHYAATAMEGNLCRGAEVAVIGGGNSAGQAAVFLSGLAKHVHLIIRRNSLRETMSEYLISRILASGSVTLHTHTEVMRLDGAGDLEDITVRNNVTNETKIIVTRNLFVMIGADPNTEWLRGQIALDAKGFVLTGGQYGFEESRYSTSMRGVYVVGDVRADSVKRVASAVGEGSVVISDIHRFLASRNAKEEES
ncbi:FAD-dependent oxidoreductase [Silvibacterium sp.]|uniref:FAD-dependent oxidoreductase n=1 Tax=Silvibacterium sp. TaxID=1964179 RepID=UPI0039E24A27